MSLINVHNLTKTYGDGHTAVHAVNDVTFTVDKGEIVLIMGPSGSGKTTLVTIMAGLLAPTSGTVIIDENDITTLTKQQLADLRLTKIGFVFQSFNLLSSLSALENVMIPLIISGENKVAANNKATQALTQLGLASRLTNLPRDLSGGEKQRVSIARALVNDPPIIFADEPTANLDSVNGQRVMEILCEVACTKGRSVVVVSHDQRIKSMATRIITIEDGKFLHEEKGGHDEWCTLHGKGTS